MRNISTSFAKLPETAYCFPVFPISNIYLTRTQHEDKVLFLLSSCFSLAEFAFLVRELRA